MIGENDFLLKQPPFAHDEILLAHACGGMIFTYWRRDLQRISRAPQAIARLRFASWGASFRHMAMRSISLVGITLIFAGCVVVAMQENIIVMRCISNASFAPGARDAIIMRIGDIGAVILRRRRHGNGAKRLGRLVDAMPAIMICAYFMRSRKRRACW